MDALKEKSRQELLDRVKGAILALKMRVEDYNRDAGAGSRLLWEAEFDGLSSDVEYAERESS